jgi:hypothetical protein
MRLQKFTPFPTPKSDSYNDKVYARNWTIQLLLAQEADVQFVAAVKAPPQLEPAPAVQPKQ